MRREESVCVGQICEKWIDLQDGESNLTLLVLGAGQVDILRKKKPWIHDEIYSRFVSRDFRVVTVDLFPYDGVDMVLDLSSPSAMSTVKECIPERCAVLLCNVLEHVPKKKRKEVFGFAETLAKNCGGLFVCTVPFDYPYHPDPIDTMFRPSCDDLLSMTTEGGYSHAETVVCGSFLEEFQRMSFFKKIRVILRPLWILSKWSKYRSKVSRLQYLFKPYKVSVIAIDYGKI